DPVPLESWNGILDGTKPPVSCLQVIILNLLNRLTVSGKEDCLRLNVYTKVPNQRNKKLPVMVFIHGGAFIVESANEYQPYILMNEDIVLVVIQYRVGIFGNEEDIQITLSQLQGVRQYLAEVKIFDTKIEEIISNSSLLK
ncbi:Venom carboxylesterase-6, partial [Armadillidium vulgare]